MDGMKKPLKIRVNNTKSWLAVAASRYETSCGKKINLDLLDSNGNIVKDHKVILDKIAQVTRNKQTRSIFSHLSEVDLQKECNGFKDEFFKKTSSQKTSDKASSTVTRHSLFSHIPLEGIHQSYLHHFPVAANDFLLGSGNDDAFDVVDIHEKDGYSAEDGMLIKDVLSTSNEDSCIETRETKSGSEGLIYQNGSSKAESPCTEVKELEIVSTSLTLSPSNSGSKTVACNSRLEDINCVRKTGRTFTKYEKTTNIEDQELISVTDIKDKQLKSTTRGVSEKEGRVGKVTEVLTSPVNKNARHGEENNRPVSHNTSPKEGVTIEKTKSPLEKLADLLSREGELNIAETKDKVQDQKPPYALTEQSQASDVKGTQVLNEAHPKTLHSTTLESIDSENAQLQTLPIVIHPKQTTSQETIINEDAQIHAPPIVIKSVQKTTRENTIDKSPQQEKTPIVIQPVQTSNRKNVLKSPQLEKQPVVHQSVQITNRKNVIKNPQLEKQSIIIQPVQTSNRTNVIKSPQLEKQPTATQPVQTTRRENIIIKSSNVEKQLIVIQSAQTTSRENTTKKNPKLDKQPILIQPINSRNIQRTTSDSPPSLVEEQSIPVQSCAIRQGSQKKKPVSPLDSEDAVHLACPGSSPVSKKQTGNANKGQKRPASITANLQVDATPPRKVQRKLFHDTFGDSSLMGDLVCHTKDTTHDSFEVNILDTSEGSACFADKPTKVCQTVAEVIEIKSAQINDGPTASITSHIPNNKNQSAAVNRTDTSASIPGKTSPVALTTSDSGEVFHPVLNSSWKPADNTIKDGRSRRRLKKETVRIPLEAVPGCNLKDPRRKSHSSKRIKDKVSKKLSGRLKTNTHEPIVIPLEPIGPEPLRDPRLEAKSMKLKEHVVTIAGCKKTVHTVVSPSDNLNRTLDSCVSMEFSPLSLPNIDHVDVQDKAETVGASIESSEEFDKIKTPTDTLSTFMHHGIPAKMLGSYSPEARKSKPKVDKHSKGKIRSIMDVSNSTEVINSGGKKHEKKSTAPSELTASLTKLSNKPAPSSTPPPAPPPTPTPPPLPVSEPPALEQIPTVVGTAGVENSMLQERSGMAESQPPTWPYYGQQPWGGYSWQGQYPQQTQGYTYNYPGLPYGTYYNNWQ